MRLLAILALLPSTLAHALSPAPSAKPEIAFWDEDLATPEFFAHSTTKGAALLCALSSSDRGAGSLLGTPPSAASPWTGDMTQALHDWYWRGMAPSSHGCDMEGFWKIGAAMKALGIGGENKCVRIEHWDSEREEGGRRVEAVRQWYTMEGKEYRVRGNGIGLG
jgi:hypothetical protein